METNNSINFSQYRDEVMLVYKSTNINPKLIAVKHLMNLSKCGILDAKMIVEVWIEEMNATPTNNRIEKHSPLPFIFDQSLNMIRMDINADNPNPFEICTMNKHCLPNLSKANAELIVRSVNAYGDMLSALKYVMEVIENNEAWWMASPDKGGFDTNKIESAINKATTI